MRQKMALCRNDEVKIVFLGYTFDPWPKRPKLTPDNGGGPIIDQRHFPC
jgi:hypothetical protein